MKLSDISKYRTELMGYAILGVLIAHMKTYCVVPDNFINKIISIVCYSVFTGGFVFLSGLGLFASMNKNWDVLKFYAKRLKRLLLPYWIISLPYFVFTDVIGSSDCCQFLGHITTLGFWINGNYSGMWYVAFSVGLYIVYPLIHFVVYRLSGRSDIGVVITYVCTLAIICCIKYAFPNYYLMLDVIWDKFILFILGSFTMNLIINRGRIKQYLFIVGGGITTKFNNNRECLANN